MAYGKVFFISNNAATVGTFTTGFDIQWVAVNSDFIITATKCGIIKVWLKERVTRVTFSTVGSSSSGH